MENVVMLPMKQIAWTCFVRQHTFWCPYFVCNSYTISTLGFALEVPRKEQNLSTSNVAEFKLSWWGEYINPGCLITGSNIFSESIFFKKLVLWSCFELLYMYILFQSMSFVYIKS